MYDDTCTCDPVTDPWCEVHGEKYFMPMWFRVAVIALFVLAAAWLVVGISAGVPWFMHLWNGVNVLLFGWVIQKSWQKI